MGGKSPNRNDEASPWSEHRDVVEFIFGQSRDPLEIVLQSFWVSIETIKRETSEGDLKLAAQARTAGERQYEKALSLIDEAENASNISLTAARQRLYRLRSEFDSLLVQEE